MLSNWQSVSLLQTMMMLAQEHVPPRVLPAQMEAVFPHISGVMAPLIALMSQMKKPAKVP